jgi:hypothetical protein
VAQALGRTRRERRGNAEEMRREPGWRFLEVRDLVVTKYKLYFDHLHSKILQYEIQPHNTYNMDEKGFMISM